MFILKKLYLTLLIIILLIFATGTIVSKSMGQDAAETFIYSSPFFVFLWVLFAAISLFIIFKKHLFKRPVTFLLHLSFILIFAGAITTWLNGKRGYISLKKSDYSDIYFSAEGETEKLPFKITVESFSIEKYPGSDAPMDYVSNITIDDKGETVKGIVSMNNILKYRNFRFYQNGIDESSDEVGLVVSYDHVGTGITYAGYLLLIVSFIFFFFH